MKGLPLWLVRHRVPVILVCLLLMIPSVLICRRSVADLICGTRQLNVYSSSK